MSDLQILFPEPEAVQLGRRKVLLKPVQLRHFELFGEVTAGLFDYLQSASVEQISAYGKAHSKQLIRLLCVTTSLSAWRIRRLPAAIQMQLLAQVVRVNAGFFVEAQVAVAKALAGQPSPTA